MFLNKEALNRLNNEKLNHGKHGNKGTVVPCFPCFTWLHSYDWIFPCLAMFSMVIVLKAHLIYVLTINLRIFVKPRFQ